jgi:hypothetical protein
MGTASMAHAQISANRLPLALLAPPLAICRLAPGASLPEWATRDSEFLTVSRTADELSITTVAAHVPSTVQCERDYRAFRVKGPLPLNLVGILASMANPLAEAGISIFAISTYDTDYVLVKGAALDSAVAVLRRVGHTVSFEDQPRAQ